jgi:hypothetical protein
MGIPDDNTDASSTGNTPTTSRVTHTPTAHGPTSICFGILLPERGLKVDESGVPIDVGIAGFEVEHQHLYDNFDWHQRVRWGVTQLADRTLNGLWLAILTSCPTNPARLPHSFYGALGNPFEEIERPSPQGSDGTIARFSEIMAGTRARGSNSATCANNNSVCHSHNFKHLPSAHIARLQDDSAVAAWLETETYFPLAVLVILCRQTISVIATAFCRTDKPAPDSFDYIDAFQFALDETMKDASKNLSDGTNDADKEPPKFTVPTTIKGFIDRVDTTYQAVR